MRSIGRALVLAATVVMMAAPVAAQTAVPSRLSFGATGGFGQTWDDEGSIGKGWLVGGYAGVRIFSHTDVELSLDLLRHDRSGGHFQAEGHTTLGSAALVQRFGGTRVNAYILGGMTLANHSGTAGFPAEGLVTQSSGTHGGFLFGGGMSFRAGRNLDLGPVVRIAMLGADSDSDPASVIMVGFRVGLRK